RQGDELVRFEKLPYEVALLRAQAALKTAQSNLRIEQGQQEVALEDWNLMKKLAPDLGTDSALALREPQLASAQAAIESAQAAVDEASYNLEHTILKAPFDGAVLSADAEVGGRAAPGAVLAHLIGTESCWVRVVLPVEQLNWIDLESEQEGKGSPVTIYLSEGSTRKGRVLRRLPDLEQDARMARVVVEVVDPLGLTPEGGKRLTPLLMNDYVRVMIEGIELEQVCSIPRSAVHDGNELWLLTADSTLHMQSVDVVWGNRSHVLARGSLAPESRLITSELATPVEGMNLRAVGEGEKTRRSAATDPAAPQDPKKESGHAQ
ncbi:MAG: HlyD family efflux transporter periplasmic adaptor subunit, partial [Lentisphaerota bacterium]